MKLTRAIMLALAALVAAFAVGCGSPGESSDDAETTATTSATERVDVAAAGDVTLTVWDQEVRGGQDAQIRRLNEQFQEKYPNVTIRRVAKSFEDLNTTLKLAVSGPRAPDVVQANQGRPVMGSLVRARLLRPLTDYAEVYGWDDRYSKLLIDLNKFSADGRQFGTGDLYGLSQMGEIVGVFYNKRLVRRLPETLEQFEAQLAEAKRAGQTPIQFGNLDKWPGIHEYETVLGRYASPQAVSDFVFAADGASFDTPEFTEAASAIQGWARAGYFTEDFNGVGYDPAWQRFTRGESPYLIAGTWLVADLARAMGDDVGFMVLPGQSADDEPVALGGEGLPFTITTASRNPDVAAAYIDFITDANAARVLVETDNLPAMFVPEGVAPTDGLIGDVFAAWRALNEANGIIPYLDYATPTFYDDISGAIQELLAGKQSPEQFTAGVQSKFSEFTGSL
ncbi:raffinose/stachyose/melibiose transport system substrate-binding protein [Conexibacter arvalis]|uniref:Raffinose/stachyose/melibiose transport system substrate-binding protein n=1 Tax=Conexibacter arvalis TaxID=912552 RepID=A0A840IAA3_9ACTN|nr:raffinose/stachyose/melibiose transport system substrate-binding protein [Conexibacter arvalis]